MAAYIRWFRLILNMLFFLLAAVAALFHDTTLYLIRQASGQWHIMNGAVSVEEYISANKLSEHELSNVRLIESVKKFSEEELGYKKTGNFTTVYDQQDKPVLWVVTASEKYRLNPFEWCFPVTGCVSYKGFFSESLAEKEKNKLAAMGYDAAIRSVSAWSTLGWLNDPLLSLQLRKSKGGFCNLLFHELFHATMYQSGKVNDNENLANFIADKATQLFLKQDTAALEEYLQKQSQTKQLADLIHRLTQKYSDQLNSIEKRPERLILKQKALVRMAHEIRHYPGLPAEQLSSAAREILTEQNAFFIDYLQYYSKQDSLENIFNNFYRGNLKMMVQSLSE